MKKNTVLVSLLLPIVFAFRLSAQCDISQDATKICKGNSITFSILAPPSSYSSIKWLFGDGDSCTQRNSQVSHVYNTTGTFKVSVTLYDASLNVTCGPKYCNVQVFDLPTAKFDLLTDSKQHFSKNLFKFSEKSLQGSSNAPIMFRKWDFGDGDSSILANPIHIYSGCGTYQIKLMVEDTNGCLDTIYKPAYIITSGPQPKFTPFDTVGCAPPFTLFVKDASSSVTKWEYIKGDGTKSVFKQRKNDSVFAIIYEKAGTFYPYLIGYDSAFNSDLGKWIICSATYADAAYKNQPHFKILVFPAYHIAFKGDTLVQSGNIARFIDLCDSVYDTLYWNWGDNNNLEKRGRGNTTHIYNLPEGIDDKVYKVELNAWGKNVHCYDAIKYWNIRVVSHLGIDDGEINDKIQVYPNPFTGQTKILLPPNSKQVSEVKLYDLNGKHIQAESIILGRSITLFRNQLLPGIYLMEIITDRALFVKVIVE